MREALIAIGTPERQATMRVGQIWQWIYHWGARDFAGDDQPRQGLPRAARRAFVIELPEVVTRQVSADGTRKYLVRLAGGHEVETVYIPEEDRGTLCISSQVGCTLTCSFCHTGTQRLVRNLTAGEIVGQVMLVRDDLGEWPRPGAPKDETRLLSNVVLMGMGEPLYNFDAVRDAMKIAMDGEGWRFPGGGSRCRPPAWCPRSPGRPKRSAACWRSRSTAPPTKSATSWCRSTANGTSRRCWRRLRDYPRLSNSERITFEYVMLKGVNDSDADARRLVKLIAGIPAKINLIPFNPWPGAPYERSDPGRIEAFADIVIQAPATPRRSARRAARTSWPPAAS